MPRSERQQQSPSFQKAQISSGSNSPHDLIGECISGRTAAWVRFEPPEDSPEGDGVVVFSVITSGLLEYDKEWFSAWEESDDSAFRPYFFEFQVQSDEFYESDDYGAMLDVWRDEGNDEWIWYLAEFSDEKGYFSDEDMLRIPGDVVSSSSPFERVGKTLTFKKENGIFTRIPEAKDLYEEYTSYLEEHGNAWDGNADQLLDPILTGDNRGPIAYIKAYSIGTANCTVLYREDNSQAILYDIGYDTQDRVPYRYAWFDKFAKDIRPDLVILSHWHIDHMIGCALLDSSVFEKQWVAPVIKKGHGGKMRISALRLAVALCHRGNICFVSSDWTNGFSQTTVPKCHPIASTKMYEIKDGKDKHVQCLELWQGSYFTNTNTHGVMSRQSSMSGPAYGAIDKENQTGLALMLRDEYPGLGGTYYRTCCLMGDVPYYSLPEEYLQRLDYGTGAVIIVPHHFSRMNLDALRVHMPPSGYAIACTRLNSRQLECVANNTPPSVAEGIASNRGLSLPVRTDAGHINVYRQKNWEVLPTGEADECIRINTSLDAKRPISLIGRAQYPSHER